MKTNNSNDRHAAVERILQHLEAGAVDLTTPYDNWLKLAFALSSLGESGRSYFHRLSRFHPEYDPAECDLQFSRCLASKGTGISLGTFFHMAREAGIPLSEPAVPKSPETFHRQEALPGLKPEAGSGSGLQQEMGVETGTGSKKGQEEKELEEDKEDLKLPGFPEEVFENLPELLKRALEPAESKEERDIILLGSIAVLSACLPSIYGIYDGLEVYSNLYLYVTAAPSSGKGKLNLCKRLVLPIHLKKQKEAKEMKVLYESLTAESDKGKEQPEKPKEKMLLLPANSSATGVFQLLADNEGRGLIFETEGDTLSNIFRSDYGNYSDGYRKCYHHETISFYRRTDREYVDIQQPCLATVLSGTPGQVHGLIPNAENGLFSRFLFYHLDLDPSWKDTFRNKNGIELLDYYHHLGLEFTRYYELLCQQPPIKVELTEEQKDRFYNFFKSTQSRYHTLLDDSFVATVRRMGLNAYRFMMVLSALRYQRSEEIPHKITCREDDFNTALSIVTVMLGHSVYIYNRLPNSKEVDEKENRRVKLLQSMPPQFSSREFVAKAAQLKMSRATAYRVLKLFLKEKLVLLLDSKLYALRQTYDLWGNQFPDEQQEKEGGTGERS